MKSISIVSTIAALASLASAGPILATRTIEKRAAVDEACNIGFASGTTGGAGGATTTVASLADFSAAAEAEGPAIIVVDGQLSGAARIRVKSNKSIIGLPGASLTNIGLYINKQENVIIRNLKISKVEASNGDAIGIQQSTNVWVDHVDVSSDVDSGKDFYDGLIDITRASDFITISNSFIHDHFKASLIGHSDSNAAQDTGKLHVTYANNHWKNVNSRNPSIRFGTAHIFNNLYENIVLTGVNTRMGANVLIESSSFVDSKNPIVSRDSSTEGTANLKDVIGADLGTVKEGSFTSVPYTYELLGSANVAAVSRTAGQTLTFDGSAPAPAPEQPAPVESSPVEAPAPVESSPVEEAPAPVQTDAPLADDEEVEEVCTRRIVKKSKFAMRF